MNKGLSIKKYIYVVIILSVISIVASFFVSKYSYENLSISRLIMSIPSNCAILIAVFSIMQLKKINTGQISTNPEKS
jgi:hypothetical protein